MTDPAYIGQLGAADPTKSGSITKAFEMIIHQQCYESILAAGYDDGRIAEYEAAMAQMMKALADSAWLIPIHAKSTPTLARADLTGFKAYRHRVEMDARNLRWAE